MKNKAENILFNSTYMNIYIYMPNSSIVKGSLSLLATQITYMFVMLEIEDDKGDIVSNGAYLTKRYRI